MFSGRSTMTGKYRESWAHQSPALQGLELQEEKRGVQNLAQWGSAWLPSSILMRG